MEKTTTRRAGPGRPPGRIRGGRRKDADRRKDTGRRTAAQQAGTRAGTSRPATPVDTHGPAVVLAAAPDPRPRCGWAGGDPLYVSYHDEGWGVPVRAVRILFEFLTLEGAQAGLACITILRKRPGYRAAFAGFDPGAVARFDGRRVRALLRDPGIVRNRAKVEAAVGNARAFLKVC